MLLSILNRKKAPSESGELSFVGHLDVFRSHLFRAVIAVGLGALIVGIYNKFFIEKVLLGPTKNDFPTYGFLCKAGDFLNMKSLCMDSMNVKMQSTGVSSQFSMFFNVILIGGFIIAFPYVLYQFWLFVRPALTKKELQNTSGVIFWVSMLFFIGVLFGYYLIAPYTMNFFANFQMADNIENIWTISSYMDTMVPMILGSGLAFQLPLVMYFLTKIGIVGSGFLRKKRKHAIVAMLVVAGIITPPDVLSQIVVTLPLMLLYEISIILASRVEKNKLKMESAQ
jgi:sec-independent protein translocase protein TatC